MVEPLVKNNETVKKRIDSAAHSSFLSSHSKPRVSSNSVVDQPTQGQGSVHLYKEMMDLIQHDANKIVNKWLPQTNQVLKYPEVSN
jgi:hypothetical protein